MDGGRPELDPGPELRAMSHKIQLQVESANRARRRAESLVHVLSAVYEIADGGTKVDAWSAPFLKSLLDMTRARRGLLLEGGADPPRIVAHLGFDAAPTPELLPDCPWGEPLAFAAAGEAPKPTLEALREVMACPNVLWVEDETSRLAVGLANTQATLQSSPLEREDDHLVRPALRAFGLLRTREAQAEALRRAQLDAERANVAKSRFLANMSHEIRTPMSGVLGVAEELLEERLPPEIDKRVRTIHDSGLVLLAVLDDILDLSKVEAGRFELCPRPTDLPRLLREVEALFRPRAEARGLELRLVLDEALPTLILADPVRLRQVLSNLVGNAVKFTAHGHVELGVSAAGDALTFRVEDTGIGISAEDQARIFEPFMQVHDAYDRAHSGTGLGLPICRRLVELMRGQIRVQSRPGAGSRFEVALPLEVVLGPLPPPEAARPSRLPGLRVLLAEDDRVNQAVSKRMLERLGHDVEVVADGQAVLRALELEAFDLVLMDVQMPILDGLEATRLVRAGEAAGGRRHLPIVALTAHAMDSQRDECLAAGMDGHVSKPLRRDALLAEMTRVLDELGGEPRPTPA